MHKDIYAILDELYTKTVTKKKKALYKDYISIKIRVHLEIQEQK